MRQGTNARPTRNQRLTGVQRGIARHRRAWAVALCATICATLLLLSTASHAQEKPCCSSDICRAQHHHGLPEAPRPKPNSKVFWIGTAALAGSTIADAVTTRENLDKGSRFIETNPVYGRRPSPAKQAGIEAALFAGQVLAFHFTEKSPHKWIRLVGRTLIGYQTVDHALLAHCNAELNNLSTPAQGCSWF